MLLGILLWKETLWDQDSEEAPFNDLSLVLSRNKKLICISEGNDLLSNTLQELKYSSVKVQYGFGRVKVQYSYCRAQL